ncbi:MAG: hypothetical protein IJR14_08080 [Synergistaceae bacterium]|nr:hypothetical protein [Synergistaceae bacterium]
MFDGKGIQGSIPDELRAAILHNGHDWEEVYWYRPDEDEDGPVARHMSYFRQRRANKGLPVPSAGAWERFLARIEEIGVFAWESKDVPEIDRDDPRWVTDVGPCTWEFEIVYQDGRRFEASGPADERPPRFDEFCAALSELMGGQEFGAG